MRRLVVLSLLLAMGLVGQAHAQPGPQPKTQSPLRSPGAEVVAVNACVREVRQAVSQKGGSQSRFEAHINPQGKIRSTGTDDEMLLFKRCMESKGYPADSR